MQILASNYTQIPNVILDNLTQFDAGELLVVMALCRLTFGWHRPVVAITNAELADKVGLSLRSLQRIRSSLADKGLLEHWPPNSPLGKSTWSLVVYSRLEEQQQAPATPAPEPTPAPKPKKAPVKKERGQDVQDSIYEKAKALAFVCQMDFEANRGMLIGNAKRLPIPAMDTIELFGPEGTWYTHDFRGKKGSPPSLKQVFTEFKKLQTLQSGEAPGASSNSNAVIKNGEIFA